MKTAEQELLHKIEVRLGLDTDIQELTDGEKADIMKMINAYSDQQNKELSAAVSEYSDKFQKYHDAYLNSNAEIQRLTKEVETMKEVTFLLSAPDAEKTARIISLTKELNDLGVKFDKSLERWQERDVKQSTELTRLRELLGRVHQGIKLDLMYIPGEKNRLQNLLTEIDNALNHKP